MQDILSTNPNETTSNLPQHTMPNLSTLTQAGKQALQELLKFGSIEQANKPNIYQTLLTQQVAANQALSALDLHAKFDNIRGLVFVQVGDIIFDNDDSINSDDHNNDNHSSDVSAQQTKTNQNTNNEQDSIHEFMQAADDTWSHPLIRKQRLTLEQSLLLAILRQRYVEAEISTASVMTIFVLI